MLYRAELPGYGLIHQEAYSGAMIGHIEDKLTIPVGLRAEIDADSGSIKRAEPAVQ